MSISITKYRKARKLYRCKWCGEQIDFRSVYAKHTNLSPDGTWMGRLHLECMVAWNECRYEEWDDYSFLRGTTEERREINRQ